MGSANQYANHRQDERRDDGKGHANLFYCLAGDIAIGNEVEEWTEQAQEMKQPKHKIEYSTLFSALTYILSHSYSPSFLWT